MRENRIHLTRVSSTNEYLSRLLRTGNSREGIVVTTDYQEQGKGQGDHHWDSEPGKNLLLSLLLKPAFLSATRQFYLSMAVSAGITDLLRERGVSSEIKWPNDILGDGRKLGGILIENSVSGTVLSNAIVGIGLNVNQDQFPEYPFPATSLSRILKRQVDREDLLEGLLSFLDRRYRQLSAGETGSLVETYHERLYRKDCVAVYRAGGETFEGVIKGVAAQGELVVESGGKERTYLFGEIRYVPTGQDPGK